MKQLRFLILAFFIMSAHVTQHANAGDNIFRQLGKDVKKAGKEVGKTGKQVGKEIGRAGKEVGKTISQETRKLFRD